MNKTELVSALSVNAGITKKDSEKVVHVLFTELTKALEAGDKVSIPSFGTFEVRTRKARTGKNPSTGEPIQIEACKLPAFKASRLLKEAVNK